MEQAVFQVLPMSIDQPEKKKKKKKGRKDLESLAIAFNLRIEKKQFRKGRFLPFYPFLLRSCAYIYIYYTVIRRSSWDFVPLFESNFRLKRGLICGFGKGEGFGGKKDWSVF